MTDATMREAMDRVERIASDIEQSQHDLYAVGLHGPAECIENGDET